MTVVPAITGIVSSGTLLDTDLLPAFLITLEDLDLIAAAIVRRNHRMLWRDGSLIVKDLDDSGEIIADLDDAINAALPDGWWFGAHEGDSAAFGIWQDDDDDDV